MDTCMCTRHRMTFTQSAGNMISYVGCLSVRLSVTLCYVAKRKRRLCRQNTATLLRRRKRKRSHLKRQQNRLFPETKSPFQATKSPFPAAGYGQAFTAQAALCLL